MRNGTPQIASLRRTLATLEAMIVAGPGQSVSEVARALAVPVPTAHRQVATLVAEGYLARLGNGRHIAGPRLRALLRHVDEKQIIANAAAPILHRLAGQLRTIVQLGTLEQDMVTYRIKTGRGAGNLFTKIGMQLEAYCSGIGKVLLAFLPDAEREAYLATGPFVALTARTITDADALRAELAAVRDRGYALDDGEVAEGLCCIAVPIIGADGRVPAAISISRTGTVTGRAEDDELIGQLRAAAAEIAAMSC